VTEGKELRGREGRGKRRGKGREGEVRCGAGPAGRQVSEAPHWQKTGLYKGFSKNPLLDP